MKTATHLEQVKTARKVLEAYERAIEAAQTLMASGPAPVSGTTVMVRTHEGFHSSTFKCSECERTCDKGDWKFCAYCGAEIIRYDLPKDPDTVTVYSQVQSPETPKTQTITLRTRQVPFEPVKIRTKITDADGKEHYEDINTFREPRRKTSKRR